MKERSTPTPQGTSGDPAAGSSGKRLISDLDDAIDRDVEVWDFTEEPKLSGQVVDVGDITTPYGESPTINVLRADGQERRVNGFGAVLSRFLPSVDVGDLVALRYLGKTTPRSGQNDYDDFRTLARNPDGSPKSRKHKAAPSDANGSPELVVQPVEDEPW